MCSQYRTPKFRSRNLLSHCPFLNRNVRQQLSDFLDFSRDKHKGRTNEGFHSSAYNLVLHITWCPLFSPPPFPVLFPEYHGVFSFFYRKGFSSSTFFTSRRPFLHGEVSPGGKVARLNSYVHYIASASASKGAWGLDRLLFLSPFHLLFFDMFCIMLVLHVNHAMI